MLKTRKIIRSNTADTFGQYQGIYGQGASNFIYGGEALAQILTHQILTVKGELKTRTDYGCDWFSIDYGSDKKIILDTQIKDILINNVYVDSIVSFDSEYNNQNGTYTANIKVLTTEGLLELNI